MLRDELRLPDEPVRIDPVVICRQLKQAVGPAPVDLGEALARVLETLTLDLALFRRARLDDDRQVMADRAARLAALSGTVGLGQLTEVCAHVGAALARDDAAAIGATAARLERLGERSLAQLWLP